MWPASLKYLLSSLSRKSAMPDQTIVFISHPAICLQAGIEEKTIVIIHVFGGHGWVEVGTWSRSLISDISLSPA